jgi:dihydrofolate reductase
LPEGVLLAANLDAAFDALAAGSKPVQTVFVIGGGQIYRLALEGDRCDVIHLTRVQGRFGCDTFLPPFGEAFVLESSSERQQERNMSYVFETWKRIAAP